MRPNVYRRADIGWWGQLNRWLSRACPAVGTNIRDGFVDLGMTTAVSRLHDPDLSLRSFLLRPVSE